jgi:hypothetical protein
VAICKLSPDGPKKILPGANGIKSCSIGSIPIQQDNQSDPANTKFIKEEILHSQD